MGLTKGFRESWVEYWHLYPIDYPARLLCSWNSPGKNTGTGSPFPFPGDLPNPGIEPKSPSLQVDSLPSEPLGKPRDTHTRILRHVEFTRSEICGWGLTPMQTIFLVFLETGVRKYLHKTFFLSYKSLRKPICVCCFFFHDQTYLHIACVLHVCKNFYPL